MTSQNQPYQLLKQRLSRQSLPPDDKDELLTYLQGLGALYRKYDEGFSDNLKLLSLPDYNGEPINLTSSVTHLDPHHPALAASTAAAAAKDEELYGRYNAASDEINALADLMTTIQKTQRAIPSADPKLVAQTSVEHLGMLLSHVVEGLTPDQMTAVMDAYEQDQPKPLHPYVRKHIEDLTSGTSPLSGLPADPDEKFALQLSILSLALSACHYRWDGLPELGEGMHAAYEQLEERVAKEERNLPDDQALADHGGTLCNQLVKPAVCGLMEHLQGINTASVKKQNILLYHGSTSTIMDALLATTTDKWARHSTNRKQLISFSMSWDGLKTLHRDAQMDPAIVPGSINAKALEHYLETKILSKPYTDDPKAARAEVQKKIGALVLNIPENPIGKIPSDAEMAALASVISKYDIPLVVADEIFSAPAYKSLITYPDMGQRCYIISGTSKNIPIETKLAFGYTENDALAHKVQQAVGKGEYIDPVRAAGLGALISHTPRTYYENNQAIYTQKRAMVSEAMANLNKDLGLNEGLQWLEEPNYGCLGVVSLPPSLTQKCGIRNSTELAEYLYKLGGVQTIPIGDVVHDITKPIGVRVNISLPDETLALAVERIGVAMQYMQERKQYKTIAGEQDRNRGRDDDRGGLKSFLAAAFQAFQQANGNERG